MNEPKSFQYKRGGYLTVVVALQSLGAAMTSRGSVWDLCEDLHSRPATAVLNQQDLVKQYTNTCLIGILTSAAK